MKKISLMLIGIVLVSGILSGCSWFNKNKEKNIIQNTFKNTLLILETLKELIQENNQNIETVMYMQGNKYRTEFEIDGKKMYSLYDGSDYYSWDYNENNGYKMSKDCMKEFESNDTSTETSNFDMDASFSTDEDFETAVSIKCESANDIDLSIPSNITFTDQCEIMRQMQNQIKELKQNMNKLGN